MKASAPATKPADPGQTGKSGFMPLFSFFSGLRPGPRQGLCPWTPLGAPPPNPGPLLKKAGENQRENFCCFPTDYAGPPLIGSGGLGSLGGSRGGRAAGCSLRQRKFQRPGGGGGVQGPGPLALAPEQARCRAQPGSGRVGVAHPPPPPRPLEFPPTPKRQRKSQAPRSMGPGCLNDCKKGQGNDPAPLGKAAAHALRAAAA